MGRKSDKQRLDEIATYIQAHGNAKAGAIAKALVLDNKTVMRALSQLEARGELLQEDDAGRISWFGRRR